MTKEFKKLKDKLESERPELWRDWTCPHSENEKIATPFVEKELARTLYAEARKAIAQLEITSLFKIEFSEGLGSCGIIIHKTR